MDFSALGSGFTTSLSILAISELLLGQIIIGVVALVGGVMAAILNRRPAMRQAQLDREKQMRADNRLHTTDQANVFEAAIQSIIEAHKQDKATLLTASEQDKSYYRRIITGYKADARKYEIMRELARRSKHNVIAELQNAYARLRILGIEDYDYKTIADICGKEDEEIDRLIIQSIEAMEQGTISGG